jgi:hypothetical protein
VSIEIGRKIVIPKLQELASQYGLLYEFVESSDGRHKDAYLFSDAAKKYRYAFARWWEPKGCLDLWIMLNPGKGDTERRRRPTIERCIKWSRAHGSAGLIFGNLFAARHNKPAELRKTADPVGAHNDEILKVLSKVANRTIVAWGGMGLLRDRAACVVPLLSKPLCLGITKSGQPRHPLYVRGATRLQPWPVN